MDPDRREDVLMVVTGAVVYGPTNNPLFRELAYSRSPDCTVGKLMERAETWRFDTPYRFNKLSDDQKRVAEDMRKSFGMMFQPTNIEISHGCSQQYEVYGTMKDAWLDHSQYSGKKTVVYYQKEVGNLMRTLGIPAMSLLELFQDEEAKAYDPLKDNRQFPNSVETCWIEHFYGCPCQGVLVRRLAEFVWSKEIVSKKTREEMKAEECREEVVDKTEAPEKKSVYSPEDATVNLNEDKATQIPEGEGPDVFEDATGDMPGDEFIPGAEGKSWDQF